MSTQRFGAPIGEGVLIIGGGVLVAVLAAAFATQVDFIWTLAVVGGLIALALVASREATLAFVLITGFVVAGVSQMYVPEARFMRYLPILASGGLLLHAIAEAFVRPPRNTPATVPLFLAFFGIGLLTMATHWSSFGMAVLGLKAYYPMWTLFLALALIRWRPEVIDSLPKAAVLLAVLQLPFVLHQVLVLVPMRGYLSGVVPVDIVAGTFGGDIRGGGANAVLTLFMIVVCACLLGLWRQGVMSALTTLLAILVLLTPVFLNGSRVALLYLPIVFCTVFSTEVLRHPGRALAGLFVTGGVVAGMLMTFTVLSDAPGIRNWQDLVVTTYENQLASEQQRADNYSGFSRWTVLTFWAEQHANGNVAEILLGHGPGATRVQPEGLDLATTLAERRYGGRQIGYTAVAALLWEVGVVGLAIVLCLFAAGFRQAGRLARAYRDSDPVRCGIAHGLRAAMIVLALSLAHKDFFAFHVPYQTLIACVFGYLAAATNLLHREQRRDRPPGTIVVR